MAKRERFSEDWVLMQVHRQYGKDEATKHLFDQISQLKQEIGRLKSELSEKDFIIKMQLKKMLSRIKPDDIKLTDQEKMAIKTDDRIAQLQEHSKKHQQAGKKAEGDMNIWRDKFLNLQARLDKMQLANTL